MSLELKKRIITSVFLLLFLICMFVDHIFLVFSLTLISLLSSYEFYKMLKKILGLKSILFYIFNLIFLTYIIIFSLFFYLLLINSNTTYFLILTLLICFASDIGGFTFGKLFKGKKLTKISPNKTISGCIGSFFFSFLIILILSYSKLLSLNYNFLIYAFSTSLLCQIGDIFISYIKRKAKVKDTGNLLPGHGGILDRIDGIIFGFPFGTFIFFMMV
jgi:phosphatidate cytidylyltransferase